MVREKRYPPRTAGISPPCLHLSMTDRCNTTPLNPESRNIKHLSDPINATIAHFEIRVAELEALWQSN